MSPRAASAPAAVPVWPDLLERVGFSDHALARFAERAALGSTNRRVVESIVRGLLLDEGRVVAQRPAWARSRRDADLLLQIGEWMLLIGARDRLRRGTYTIVTAVNGRPGNTWRRASRAGLVATSPPMPTARPRVSLFASISRGLQDRRPGEGPLTAVRRTDRARRARAQAAYDRAMLERWRGRAPR